MWRKLLILPPILLGAFAVWWFASSRQLPETAAPREEVRNVRIIQAAKTNVVPRVTGFGTAQPAKTWKAIVQAAGEIDYVHPQLKRGAILPGGTQIIRISPRDYELAIAQAQANISRAEAQIAEFDLAEQNTRSSLEIERQSLAIRERELARKEELVRSGTTSRTALDQETRDTLVQRKKVQDLENTLRLIPAQRAALVQQKKLNQIELEQARTNLQRTRIVLPFDARIAEVSAEASQYAQVGTTLASVDGIDATEVEAQIPLSQFAALARAAAGGRVLAGVTPQNIRRIVEQLGFTATVRLNTGGQDVSWPARFSRVSDTIDVKTRSVGVIVTVEESWKTAVPGQRPPLSKGMFVEVEIRAKQLPNRIVLPREAVHDGKVFLAGENNRLVIRPVRTGLEQGHLVIIEDGVDAGDSVVITDLLPAIEGMLLRPVRDRDLEARIAESLTGAPG